MGHRPYPNRERDAWQVERRYTTREDRRAPWWARLAAAHASSAHQGSQSVTPDDVLDPLSPFQPRPDARSA